MPPTLLVSLCRCAMTEISLGSSVFMTRGGNSAHRSQAFCFPHRFSQVKCSLPIEHSATGFAHIQNLLTPPSCHTPPTYASSRDQLCLFTYISYLLGRPAHYDYAFDYVHWCNCFWMLVDNTPNYTYVTSPPSRPSFFFGHRLLHHHLRHPQTHPWRMVDSSSPCPPPSFASSRSPS